MTSFHKNNIFVKTRKVMGNTDVAHYRGQLATALPTFLLRKNSKFSNVQGGTLLNRTSLYDGQLEFV